MDDGATAPLSFAQARLWLVNAVDPQSTAYNLRTAYRLRGPLDADVLGQSLTDVVARHDILRTTFRVIDGEPTQVIAPPGAFGVAVWDLRGWPAASRAAEAERRLALIANAPFDMSAGPLIRAELIRLAPDEHILILVVHHTIFDGASVTPFNWELSACYAARRRGQPPLLEPLPLQYADFATQQRRREGGDAAADDRAFWQRALADAPARIELPASFPGPHDVPSSGAIRSTVLDARVAELLASFGQTRSVTLFVLLYAAFNALLYRLTGQGDLVIGSPIASRERTELEPLIGYFVNLVPLRVQIDAATTFDELVRAARRTIVDALDHPHVPFDQLTAQPGPDRHSQATPRTNVIFFARTEPEVALRLDGCNIERYPLPSGEAKFDLSFRYAHEHGELICSLQYPTNRFTDATIDALLDRFATFVRALVATPDVPIATLSMLDPIERATQLAYVHPARANSPGRRSVPDLFAAQVARDPTAIAIASDDLVWSYRELDARARALAQQLRTRGVQRGQIVAIACERSEAVVVAMLAILKARGVYLPLDPRHPPQRVLAMIADADARLVLTDSAIASGEYGQTPTLRVDLAPRVSYAGETRDPGADDARDADEPTDPANIAYVMYTSGTTGRPKGALITHGAIANLVTACPAIANGPADVVAQIASVAFDAATFEIWGALLAGARLDIAPRDTVLEPATFAAWVRERGISVAFVTSALLRHIVRAEPAAFAPLRCLIAGGDVVDPPTARAILRHGPPRHFLNGYGPTETTTFATTFAITTADDRPIPIGRPLDNVEAYILDAGGNLVPPGVRGELFIGGAGLARGYLNDPELTARKFIAHPFSNEPTARLYATGDIASFRGDGVIEFFGRADRQRKIRGYRVELDEIEAALLAIAEIDEAVVTIAADAHGEPRLVAYVVESDPDARDRSVWRQSLSARLVDAMLPDEIIAVAQMPLSANGKIDLTALAALAASSGAPEKHATDDPPQPGLETAIAAIIAEVLGIATVGRSDDFFALGGHSLLATRVIGRIGDRLQVELAVRDLFRAPTVAQLAQRVAIAPPRASAGPLTPRLDARVAELSDDQVDALLAEALRE